jgi:predicted RNA-binding Zn ribbon-like protein
MEPEFPLVGEALIVDLINTRPTTPTGPVDLLATPAGLRAWLALQADRLDPGGAAADPDAADLARVHAIREHAARALDRARHGHAPAPADRRVLNVAMRAAPAYPRLHVDGDTLTAPPHRDGPFGIRLAAVLAEAAVELLTSPAVTAVRDCAAPECTLLFVPAHPRRQWCSAARCGNRARVARYYQRHRTTG